MFKRPISQALHPSVRYNVPFTFSSAAARLIIMSTAIRQVIAKRKEKKARRNLENRDNGKYTIDNFGPIESAFDRCGRLGNPFDVTGKDESNDDMRSVCSFSTTATTDDNRGAGYTVDRYFYQPVGRRIESLASRIAMPILSPSRIFQYIEEHRPVGVLSFYHHFPETYTAEKTVYTAGLNSLVHQTQ